MSWRDSTTSVQSRWAKKSSSICVAVQVPEGGEKRGKDFCGVKQAGAESTLAGYAGQGNHLNCSPIEQARIYNSFKMHWTVFKLGLWSRWASGQVWRWTRQDSNWSGTSAGVCSPLFYHENLSTWVCSPFFQPGKFLSCVNVQTSGMNELGTLQKIHPGVHYSPKRTLISTISGLYTKTHQISALAFW